MGVLESIAIRVPGPLGTPCGCSRKEFLQAGFGQISSGIELVLELQSAPESAIKDLRDGSAPEFVTKFDVVFSVFPGDVINIVPVGVHALAGVGLIRA